MKVAAPRAAGVPPRAISAAPGSARIRRRNRGNANTSAPGSRRCRWRGSGAGRRLVRRGGAPRLVEDRPAGRGLDHRHAAGLVRRGALAAEREGRALALDIVRDAVIIGDQDQRDRAARELLNHRPADRKPAAAGEPLVENVVGALAVRHPRRQLGTAADHRVDFGDAEFARLVAPHVQHMHQARRGEDRVRERVLYQRLGLGGPRRADEATESNRREPTMSCGSTM